jgi:hypothetical protein
MKKGFSKARTQNAHRWNGERSEEGAAYKA